jgi:hypothetical protein
MIVYLFLLFRVMIGCDSLGESGAAPPPLFLSIEERKTKKKGCGRVARHGDAAVNKSSARGRQRREQVPSSFDSPSSFIFFSFLFLSFSY